VKGANSLGGTLQLFFFSLGTHYKLGYSRRVSVVSPLRKRNNLNYKTSVEDRLNKWYDPNYK